MWLVDDQVCATRCSTSLLCYSAISDKGIDPCLRISRIRTHTTHYTNRKGLMKFTISRCIFWFAVLVSGLVCGALPAQYFPTKLDVRDICEHTKSTPAPCLYRVLWYSIGTLSRRGRGSSRRVLIPHGLIVHNPYNSSFLHACLLEYNLYTTWYIVLEYSSMVGVQYWYIRT